jgi:hypothetical protein
MKYDRKVHENDRSNIWYVQLGKAVPVSVIKTYNGVEV